MESLAKLRSLTVVVLNLSENNLKASECRKLANALENLTLLTSLSLNLNFNTIGESGC